MWSLLWIGFLALRKPYVKVCISNYDLPQTQAEKLKDRLVREGFFLRIRHMTYRSEGMTSVDLIPEAGLLQSLWNNMTDAMWSGWLCIATGSMHVLVLLIWIAWLCSMRRMTACLYMMRAWKVSCGISYMRRTSMNAAIVATMGRMVFPPFLWRFSLGGGGDCDGRCS